MLTVVRLGRSPLPAGCLGTWTPWAWAFLMSLSCMTTSPCTSSSRP